MTSPNRHVAATLLVALVLLAQAAGPTAARGGPGAENGAARPEAGRAGTSGVAGTSRGTEAAGGAGTSGVAQASGAAPAQAPGPASEWGAPSVPDLPAAPGAAGAGATSTDTAGRSGSVVDPSVANFPPSASGYHNYPEMVAHIHDVAAAHPDIVKLYKLGKSYQGREIWAAKVSDNVAVDENQPEILFDALHHAREHLSAEMAIYILDMLTSNYDGTDALGQQVTDLVNSREIWIIFMVNPDGAQYDLTGSPYRAWRKNRQPTPGSSAIGTDLNRNYGYDWGCCGGSSGDPFSDTYRGPHAWSAPETRVIRDFVLSRVINGVQQIRANITFHTAGEQVLWPYGHTYTKVPKDMTALDHSTFVAMGKAMAATNGYTPMQSSSLYITDGDEIDWLYGTQRIFSFTFEMYPQGGLGTNRFYPPDGLIARETSRNRAAVLYLIQKAGCPYAAVGKAAAYCGPFFDDFEIDRGWTVNAYGTDTATGGLWARGIAHASTFQLGTAVSGQGVFATGLAAGHDVDGGTTTASSPMIQLPAGASTLHLSYWVGMGANATSVDRFAVRLVAADGTRLATALVVVGDGIAHAPAWKTLTFAIPAALAGKTVAIELFARDAGTPSTVEAGVDQARITAP